MRYGCKLQRKVARERPAEEQPEQATSRAPQLGTRSLGQSSAVRTERHLKTRQAVHSSTRRQLSAHQELFPRSVSTIFNVMAQKY